MWKIVRQIARAGIRTEAPPFATRRGRSQAVERIQKEMLDILGQALAIRQVDAGSCNGCELEIHALNNPYYNLEGLGIRFVASPRHADMLLVTGPVSRNMEMALRRTYDATPEPRLVVAVGDCGRDGGIFGESYATCGARGQRAPGGRDGAGLPAAADRDPARHPQRGSAPPLGRHRRRADRLAGQLHGAHRGIDREARRPWRRRRPPRPRR